MRYIVSMTLRGELLTQDAGGTLGVLQILGQFGAFALGYMLTGKDTEFSITVKRNS